MKKFNLKKFKSEAKGFTLIELLIAIAFIAVASALIYVVYNRVKETGDANAEGRNLDLIRAGIKNLYANSNSYGDPQKVTNTFVNQARITPDTMRQTGVVNDSITNKFGGAVLIAPASLGSGTNNAFSITYRAVPAGVCVKLVTTAGTQFDQVNVGGTDVKVFGGQLNPVAAATACGAAESTGVELIFTSL